MKCNICEVEIIEDTGYCGNCGNEILIKSINEFSNNNMQELLETGLKNNLPKLDLPKTDSKKISKTNSKSNTETNSKSISENNNFEITDEKPEDYLYYLRESVKKIIIETEGTLEKGDTPKNVNIIKELLKEIWSNGKKDAYEEKAIHEIQKKLELTDEMIITQELLIRKEFGLLQIHHKNPIQISLVENKPVYSNETGILHLKIKNISEYLIKQVEIRIACSLFLQDFFQKIQFIHIGEEKDISLEYTGILEGTRLIYITAIVRDYNDTVRVYKNAGPVKLKILKEGVSKQKKAIRIQADRGGLANLDNIPEEMLECLEINVAQGGVVNLEGMKKVIEKCKTKNIENQIIIKINYNDEETQAINDEFEKPKRAMMTESLKPRKDKLTKCVLKIKNHTIQKKVYIYSKAEIILGQPKSESDIWLALFPLNRENINLTKHISRKHLSIKFFGDSFKLMDLNSSNGTILNAKMMDKEKWIELKTKNSINIGGVLRLNCDVKYDFAKKSIKSFSNTELKELTTNELINEKCFGIENKGEIRNLRIKRVNNSPVKEEYYVLLRTLRIGSSPDVDLVINSKEITEVNAQIYYKDRMYWIENISSKENVLVNGQKVLPNYNVSLSIKDTIIIGDTELVIES